MGVLILRLKITKIGDTGRVFRVEAKAIVSGAERGETLKGHWNIRNTFNSNPETKYAIDAMTPNENGEIELNEVVEFFGEKVHRGLMVRAYAVDSRGGTNADEAVHPLPEEE